MKRIGRATLAVAATLCVGLLLAAAAASWQVKHNRERAREAFGSLAERVTAEVSARMRIYQFWPAWCARGGGQRRRRTHRA